jgi:uncharacterized protein with HEPN domain
MNRETQYLFDMLNAAQLALEYLQDQDEEAFYSNPMLQDAVVRRFEIIGEAAKRISSATQSTIVDIPWKDVIGMRNILIHDYDDISLRVVWQTAQEQLPVLIPILEREIAKRTLET